MSRTLVSALLVLALACGGGGTPAGVAPQEQATSPEGAVRNFMQALADSNIARMGRYWGNAHGPASVTHQPADYTQRLAVAQAFLRDSPFRVSRTDPSPTDKTRQTVQVEFDRADIGGKRCVKSVPFVVVDAGKHGWIVNSIDLTQAGTPGRPCTPPSKG